MGKYVISLDLSLSNTGVCIFDENGTPVDVFSIKTNVKHSHGERLKTIADAFIEARNKYDISTMVCEQGFSRHNLSTQAIFKCHGIANYIFYDCEQIYYAPSSVKKAISGSGKSEKDILKRIIEKRYPDLVLSNEDQSDAVAVGLAYFIDKNEEGMNKNGKGL